MISKEIWVLPELKNTDGEVDKISLGLLTNARNIAEKVSGMVTAAVFDHQDGDYQELLGKYGVNRAYVHQSPFFEHFSAEIITHVIAERIRRERPWLVLLADTSNNRELAARLAALLDTAAVTNCVKIDLNGPQAPRFYRAVFGNQLYQEIVFASGRTMVVTRAPHSFEEKPAPTASKPEISIFKPDLDPLSFDTRHVSYPPADYQNMDISNAKTIVGAGMGAVTDELMPLVEELTALLQGSLGTTRPVVDEGKISRERLIGQTGKIVSPDTYLALGISGATHHIAGIQDAGKIVVINRDRQAPFVNNADFNVLADLKELLPVLIRKILQARENGEIL